MREVELKSVVDDPEALVDLLRAARCEFLLEGWLSDRRYDTPDRALLARDNVLRIREFQGKPESHATLDFKGPTGFDHGYKVREEISTSIDNASTVAQMLAGLGYVVIREIDRAITQVECCGATVRIERYPRMDALVEVEGEPDAIEAAIAVTKLPRAGFTTERLADFVLRYEARTGQRAALCHLELTGEFPYARNA
jgi:predicted adenylyl cyclase CyaB